MNTELLNENTKTPIEIALEMTQDGMVSAKRLYDFLELAPSQYARWCRDNILDNPLLDENVDFKPFRHNVENSISGRPSDDYLLSIEVAKELCMTCRSEKGRLARDYFKKTEQALVVSVKQYNELINTTKLLSERVDQLGALVQSSVQELKTEVFSHIDLLESKSEVMLTHETDWAMDMMEHVRKIAEVYTRGDTSKCMDRLIERAEEYLGEPYKNYEADYALRHNGKRGKKIFVMARDEDSRSAFEQAVKDFEMEWGIYKQNEGQKRLEKIMDGMIEEIVPDPPVPQHIMTDAELESQWADMDKMYGEGWDKQPDIPSVEEPYGG